MSINIDGTDMNAEVDYSDFEYQHMSVTPAYEPSGQGARDDTQHSFEPLEDRGGLDNDEVAELISLETYADVEYEDEEADQNVGSSAEARGIIGSNLAASVGQYPNNASTIVDQTESFGDSEQVTSGSRVGNGKSLSDPAIFQLFKTQAGIAFDDQTNGLGGGASFDHFYSMKNFRQLTGRGPVLDATDDIDVNCRVVVGDAIVRVGADIRMTAIWDVVEVDDAGQRFSVPR